MESLGHGGSCSDEQGAAGHASHDRQERDRGALEFVVGETSTEARDQRLQTGVSVGMWLAGSRSLAGHVDVSSAHVRPLVQHRL
ncbi:MAG TPA: hypothetical protein VGD80_15150 [Kofleriaceae bacterium]